MGPILEFQDVVVSPFVHPLRPSGEPAPEHGVTVLDPERLLEALEPLMPELRPHLDPDAYREAQNEDVLRWLALLDPRLIAVPESLDHLMKTIKEAGVAARRIG